MKRVEKTASKNKYPTKLRFLVWRLQSVNPKKEVISEIKDQLAGFKAPKEVKFIDQLPRNAMGKVQKNILRETFS